MSSLFSSTDEPVSLEVEAGRDLAGSLVDGVADLLHVDLGGDVEGRHATNATAGQPAVATGIEGRRAHPGRPGVRYLRRVSGRYPSGQREQTVNLPAQPS